MNIILYWINNVLNGKTFCPNYTFKIITIIKYQIPMRKYITTEIGYFLK